MGECRRDKTLLVAEGLAKSKMHRKIHTFFTFFVGKAKHNLRL